MPSVSSSSPLPQQPTTDTVDYLVAAAHALAYVLIASRRHTDLFEWAQRDVPFSLVAELQRRLLPSAYTAEGGSFTIAGWLEPAHDAGGDTFDYTVDREYLYAEPYTAQALQLWPGDRLLLLTDGYRERSAARLDIEAILAATLDRHPRQVVREITHNVVRATGGKLPDDATAVCIGWYGPAGRRDAVGGASPARATSS